MSSYNIAVFSINNLFLASLFLLINWSTLLLHYVSVLIHITLKSLETSELFVLNDRESKELSPSKLCIIGVIVRSFWNNLISDSARLISFSFIESCANKPLYVSISVSVRMLLFCNVLALSFNSCNCCSTPDLFPFSLRLLSNWKYSFFNWNKLNTDEVTSLSIKVFASE